MQSQDNHQQSVLGQQGTQLRGEPPVGGNRFTEWLGKSLLNLTGWEIKGKIPKFKKLVIAVAPHTSNWDFFLGVTVLFALRIRIRFLGKHSIFIPGVKQLLNSIGGIPVDRRAAHGVVDQIATQFNQESEMILAVAPEGTRSPIYPWKTGFLAMAHKAKVPVQLIGFDFKLKQVIIGPIIHTSGDYELDMQLVYTYFASINAKHPENMLIKEP